MSTSINTMSAEIEALRLRAIAAREEYRYGASAEGWMTRGQAAYAKRLAVALTRLYNRAMHAWLASQGAGLPRHLDLTGFKALRAH